MFDTVIEQLSNIVCNSGVTIEQKKQSVLQSLQSLNIQLSDAKCYENQETTVLNVIACSGDLELLKWVIESQGADLKTIDKYGRTALHMAAAYGHLQCVNYLIEKGVDINARTIAPRKDPVSGECLINSTPLHLAIRFGHVDAVNALLNNNADASIKVNQTMNAIEWAIYLKRQSINILDDHNSKEFERIFGEKYKRVMNRVPSSEQFNKICFAVARKNHTLCENRRTIYNVPPEELKKLSEDERALVFKH